MGRSGGGGEDKNEVGPEMTNVGKFLGVKEKGPPVYCWGKTKTEKYKVRKGHWVG